MGRITQIPVYSLGSFQSDRREGSLFQVEPFDAHRHFQVSYPHRHDFYEVLYLYSGTGNHIIDSNIYQVKPPCIFFLSPGQAHKLELSHDIEGFIFLFTSDFYLSNQKNKKRLFEFPFFFSIEQKNPPLSLQGSSDEGLIRKTFERGCSEAAKKKEASHELIRGLLDLILLLCDQMYPVHLRSMQNSKGHILVKNFLSLIEEHYHKNYRVSQYAEMLAITPNHLTQMVRQVTGKSSVQLLHEKVISEIKRLLLHTHLSVSEIADVLHFPDQSYFSKYFKKYEGISPIAFRNKSSNQT